MEEEEGGRKPENGRKSIEQQQQEEEEEEEEEEEKGEHEVVKFLDSVDSCLTLIDSLSSILRQGWLELASARHCMGASRINSGLFDLNYHSAATSLQVNEDDVYSTMKHCNFTLSKWVSPDNKKCSSEEAKFDEDDLLQRKSTNPQLRHRGTPEIQEKRPESNGSTLPVDNQILSSKSLSMFGTLVSPKLRTTQLSFETALDTLVEIANMRSSMLSAYDQVQKDMECTRG